MTDPFATPEKLLKTPRHYQVKPELWSGDGFFIDEHYNSSMMRSVPEWKIRTAFFMCLIIMVVLLGRVWYLQIIKGDEYHAIAEGNRIRLEIISSPRGLFYDKNGEQLVANAPKFSLVLEREAWLKNKKSVTELGEIIKNFTIEKSTDIEKKLNEFVANDSDPAIAFDINYDQALLFKSAANNYQPWRLQINSWREQTEPNYLSHILGYLGRITANEWPDYKNKNYQFIDWVGKSGLEKEYESILRGEPGWLEYEVDALGQVIKTMGQREPTPGSDLKLTIDVKLNQKLGELLSAQTKAINRPKAVAIAMDPKTGGILALISLPTFNNNFFSDPAKYQTEITNYLTDKDQPLYNRAISGQYPSGSTIKPLWALAALEEKIINRETSVMSVGGIQIGQWFYPDWKAGGHGITNIIKGLAESVNTFFYYIGGGYENFVGLGLDKILLYGQKFGLNQTLGIDLPNEATGFLPTKQWKEETKKEKWYIGDTYHLAIGQGDLLVTPLQIASMTATIANGGTLYRPHLVEKINGTMADKNYLAPFVLKTNLANLENIEIVRQGLRQAVVSGSAQALNNLGVKAAGKTGTAQPGGSEPAHAWFTVFAPYDDPQIVLTILIENGGEGSATAVPVARDLLKWYFSNKKLENVSLREISPAAEN